MGRGRGRKTKKFIQYYGEEFARLDEIRRRFRRETGNLDNWIYHRRLSEYFKEDEKDADKTS